MKRLLIIAIAFTMASCASTNMATGPNNAGESNEVKTQDEANLPLSSYLRRVPGLMIQGSGDNVTIMIRGASTASGSTNPLFVVDKMPVGNNYAQVANMVDVNSIKTVRVLKDASETAAYGSRGANGVVEIITKKK